MSVDKSIILELMFESKEEAQKILDAKMPGYTIEILESGTTLILNSEEDIVATIEVSK